MNGPEHYAAAEALIDHAEGLTDAPNVANHLAAAQVHATLAAAAATVSHDRDQWEKVGVW